MGLNPANIQLSPESWEAQDRAPGGIIKPPPGAVPLPGVRFDGKRPTDLFGVTANFQLATESGCMELS